MFIYMKKKHNIRFFDTPVGIICNACFTLNRSKTVYQSTGDRKREKKSGA